MATADIQYDIKKQIATLSEPRKGWKKELNLISWNGLEPKYDIRQWNEDHSKCNKGITFTEAELVALRDALNRM